MLQLKLATVWLLPAFLSMLRQVQGQGSCTHATYKPCVQNGKPTGLRCPDHGHCVERKAWCALSDHLYSRKVKSCKNFENMKFSSCFRANFTLDVGPRTLRYIYVKAKTGWDTAEMFCQSQGYNLVSFGSQEEFDKVIDYLKAMKNTAKKGIHDANKDFKDPLGQICWQDQSEEDGFWMVRFWLGLFYNLKQQKWQHTDNTPIEWNLQGSEAAWRNQSYLYNIKTADGWYDKAARGKYDNGEFWRNYDFGRFPNYGGFFTFPDILCKRDPHRPQPVEWYPKTLYFDVASITGYSCPITNRAIIGPEFANSQILDGDQNCLNRQDEIDLKTPFIRVPTDDPNRAFIFYPLMVQPTALRNFCENYNESWYLPSIHNIEKDASILRSLPWRFGQSRPELDFWFQSTDWETMELEYVLLGAGDQEGFWTDGSKIKAEALNITQRELSSMTERSYLTYLKLNQSIQVKQSQDFVYAICQEGQAPNKALPVPVGNHHIIYGLLIAFLIK